MVDKPVAIPRARACPSAAYPAFSSLQHPTQSIPGKPTMASSMGNAKSPATPNTLEIPRSLSLDRTCSITVVDAASCDGADCCDLPLLDFASFVGANTPDILGFLKVWVSVLNRQIGGQTTCRLTHADRTQLRFQENSQRKRQHRHQKPTCRCPRLASWCQKGRRRRWQ